MKITVDKDFTRISQVDEVKEAIKEFRSYWDESSLYSQFRSEYDEVAPENTLFGGEVVQCSVSAFPAGYEESGEYDFSVYMLVDCGIALYRIRFYINDNGEIRLSAWDRIAGKYIDLYSVEKYELVKE